MRALAVAVAVAAVLAGLGPAVDAVAADPAVTVDVAPSSPQVGQRATVSGDGTDADGQPVADAMITAARDDSAGSHPLTAVDMADASGHYSFTDTPDVYGQVTWTVTWQGPPETSGHQTVTVTRKPTALTLDVSDHRVRSGARVELTAHLGSPSTDRTVSIYARPYNQSRRLVERGSVNADDNLKTSYHVARRTTFIARFDG